MSENFERHTLTSSEFDHFRREMGHVVRDFDQFRPFPQCVRPHQTFVRPNYARPLVEEVNAGYAAFFAVYIAGVTFAMFRIITALFLKDTLTVASADMEEMIHEKMRDKAAFAQKLLDFFMAADISGDGYLTVEEFDAILQDERVKAYLSILELDTFQTRRCAPPSWLASAPLGFWRRS